MFDQEPYKAQLEPMLAQYVQPLFASHYGHLRAKAAWVAGLFADIRCEVVCASQALARGFSTRIRA